jgi:hypothetical protein
VIRHCNGTDPYLLDGQGQPCACGQRFDDVRFGVVWPHHYIPTRPDRAAFIVAHADEILPKLRAAHPGLDWDAWLAEQRAIASEST